MANKYEHIKIIRDENAAFQTKTECLICGAVNFISDCAEDESVQANKRWFIAQHEECGFFEKTKAKRHRARDSNERAKIEKCDEPEENNSLPLESRYEEAYQSVYAELLKMAKNPVQKERFRNALLKAKEEIRLNSKIHYECGVLTFISRQSGERRIVTAIGCHPSCDCRNRISYHWALYEIFLKVGED